MLNQPNKEKYRMPKHDFFRQFAFREIPKDDHCHTCSKSLPSGAKVTVYKNNRNKYMCSWKCVMDEEAKRLWSQRKK